MGSDGGLSRESVTVLLRVIEQITLSPTTPDFLETAKAVAKARDELLALQSQP